MTGLINHGRTARITPMAPRKESEGPSFITMGRHKQLIREYVKEELCNELVNEGSPLKETIDIIAENKAKQLINGLRITGCVNSHISSGRIEIMIELQDSFGMVIPNSNTMFNLGIIDLLRGMKVTGIASDLFPALTTNEE